MFVQQELGKFLTHRKKVNNHGKKIKYSHLGDSTYLFLNQLIKRGICVCMRNERISVQNIVMDLIKADDFNSSAFLFVK